MIFPKIEKNFVLVFIKLKGQENFRKAMYYRNGGKPCFASYGSAIEIDRIEEWCYANS